MHHLSNQLHKDRSYAMTRKENSEQSHSKRERKEDCMLTMSQSLLKPHWEGIIRLSTQQLWNALQLYSDPVPWKELNFCSNLWKNTSFQYTFCHILSEYRETVSALLLTHFLLTHGWIWKINVMSKKQANSSIGSTSLSNVSIKLLSDSN